MRDLADRLRYVIRATPRGGRDGTRAGDRVGPRRRRVGLSDTVTHVGLLQVPRFSDDPAKMKAARESWWIFYTEGLPE
jgi:hypothetical protein